MSKGRDSKPHIGIFGRRNNGKSSLINALTGQEIAIVSDVAGTTTDPVKKSIEIAGIGPVIVIDTAGIDDSGELGMKRVNKTRDVLKIIDMAILVLAGNQFDDTETDLIKV
jgi:small GTP-binding protein